MGNEGSGLCSSENPGGMEDDIHHKGPRLQGMLVDFDLPVCCTLGGGHEEKNQPMQVVTAGDLTSDRIDAWAPLGVEERDVLSTCLSLARPNAAPTREDASADFIEAGPARSSKRIHGQAGASMMLDEVHAEEIASGLRVGQAELPSTSGPESPEQRQRRHEQQECIARAKQEYIPPWDVRALDKGAAAEGV